MATAIFGAGCFWGVELAFGQVKGVINTSVGYTGGATENPTYEQVCTGDTEHIEVVNVQFDPKIISYEDITRLFFKFHDPTTPNRQGPNVGYQYRSEIFYSTDDEKKIAQKVLNEVNNRLDGKVVTRISKEKNYVKAENYHQKYFQKKNSQ